MNQKTTQPALSSFLFIPHPSALIPCLPILPILSIRVNYSFRTGSELYYKRAGFINPFVSSRSLSNYTSRIQPFPHKWPQPATTPHVISSHFHNSSCNWFGGLK